jgi:hypothetical protein
MRAWVCSSGFTLGCGWGMRKRWLDIDGWVRKHGLVSDDSRVKIGWWYEFG